MVVIRKLAEFMRSQDFDAYVTPIVIKNRRSNFTPHIYTNSQLKRIFTQSDFCPSYTNCPNRSAVASLIFRMIYGCGLRLSEALNLNVRDVDLENGVLIILNSKFKTNRLTPMAPELTERCRFFYSALHLFSEPDAVFFPAPDGGRYSQEAIGRTFHQILSSAGISRTETGPRIHDLRHTFAVNCLKKWVREGKDINSVLPVLSAYLGHKNLKGTQDYLRLTADMFPEITHAVEYRFSEIIPKWGLSI